MADVIVDLLQGLTIERSHAAEQLVSDAAETPDINLFVVLLLSDQLRCHEEWSAEDQVHTCIPVELLSKA